MRVRLSFATFFSRIIGIDCVELVLPERTTVAEAIDFFLQRHPEYFRLLDERKLFLFGDFRAVYHINRLVVKKDHVLNNDDDLKILKTFIGG